MNEQEAAEYAAWLDEVEAAHLAREQEEDHRRAVAFSLLALGFREGVDA